MNCAYESEHQLPAIASTAAERMLCINSIYIAVEHDAHRFARNAVGIKRSFHALAFRNHLRGKCATQTLHCHQNFAKESARTLITQTGDGIEAMGDTAANQPAIIASKLPLGVLLWIIKRPLAAKRPVELPKAFQVGQQRDLAMHRHFDRAHTFTFADAMQTARIAGQGHNIVILIHIAQLPFQKAVKTESAVVMRMSFFFIRYLLLKIL